MNLISPNINNKEVQNSIGLLNLKDNILYSYISAPIISGKNRNREMNIKDLNNFHNNLVNKIKYIINPSFFHKKDWVSHDYLFFWKYIINNYVKEIIFISGWNYSGGCSFEFLIGFLKGIPLLDHNLNEIKLTQAIKLIKESILFKESNNIFSKLQTKTLNILVELWRENER